MKKKIFWLLKRVCLAFMILYTFNLFLEYTSVMIPINIPTLASVTMMGIPGFLAILAMFFIIR